MTFPKLTMGCFFSCFETTPSAAEAKIISEAAHKRNVEREYKSISDEIRKSMREGYKDATICGKQINGFCYFTKYRLSDETKTRLADLGYKTFIEGEKEHVWWD